jgi:1-acyl-sn-glycerol-3-phosphate acyltransferase
LFTGAHARWPEGLLAAPAPRIFFANHTSNLDFVVLWSVLPPPVRRRTRAAAARDYWTGGPVRRWLASSVFNVVLIERKQVTRANNPVRELGAVLQVGDSIILFPEGGRFLRARADALQERPVSPGTGAARRAAGAGLDRQPQSRAAQGRADRHSLPLFGDPGRAAGAYRRGDQGRLSPSAPAPR